MHKNILYELIFNSLKIVLKTCGNKKKGLSLYRCKARADGHINRRRVDSNQQHTEIFGYRALSPLGANPSIYVKIQNFLHMHNCFNKSLT